MVQGPDETIGRIGGAQHGIVGRREAVARGVSPSAVDRRRRNGRLIWLARGTYLVGGAPLDRAAQIMAAVRSSGPGAVASHGTAAELWGLVEPMEGRLHVTVQHARHHGRYGDRIVHRARTLGPADVSERDAIPVTCAERTLVDVAGVFGARMLEATLDTALLRHLVSIEGLLAYIESRSLGNLRGVGRLRRLLHDRARGVPESELERAFLRLVRRAGLPEPARQVQVGPYRVDFAYTRERVVIELDGRSHERGRAIGADRTRQNALILAGWRVLRFTWADVTERPDEVAEIVQAAIQWGDSPPASNT